MMNINRVTLTGNLTKDPESKLVGENQLTKLRVAVNGRKKVDGVWADDPNYFDVIIWGKQAENAAQYLSRGRGVAVDGRLNWREWETDDGSKRQSVEIVAQSVQFLGGNDERPTVEREVVATAPAAAAAVAEDDIPF